MIGLDCGKSRRIDENRRVFDLGSRAFGRGFEIEDDVSSSTLNTLFIGFGIIKKPSYPVLIQTRGKKISAFNRSDAGKRSPRSTGQTRRPCSQRGLRSTVQTRLSTHQMRSAFHSSDAEITFPKKARVHQFRREGLFSKKKTASHPIQ